jgi:hypothetical protein
MDKRVLFRRYCCGLGVISEIEAGNSSGKWDSKQSSIIRFVAALDVTQFRDGPSGRIVID